MKVLPERFHLNGHTAGFRPQTQKLHCSPATLQDSAMAIKGLRERRNICTVSLSRAEINQICSAFQTREHFPWFCITVIFSCGLASEKNKTLKDLLVSSPSARPNFVIQYRSKGSWHSILDPRENRESSRESRLDSRLLRDSTSHKCLLSELIPLIKEERSVGYMQ